MFKPTSAYKMTKTTKRMLALGHFTTEQRNAWKKCMIQAELAYEHARRTAGKRSKDDGKE